MRSTRHLRPPDSSTIAPGPGAGPDRVSLCGAPRAAGAAARAQLFELRSQLFELRSPLFELRSHGLRRSLGLLAGRLLSGDGFAQGLGVRECARALAASLAERGFS